MKHKQFYFIGLSALALVILFLPGHSASAVKLSSRVTTVKLAGVPTSRAVPPQSVPPQAVPAQAVPPQAVPPQVAPPSLAGVPAQAMPLLQANWDFPCSDIPNPRGRGLQPDEKLIRHDWLSGDVPVVTKDTTFVGGGRLFYTYSNDTEDLLKSEPYLELYK